MLLCRRQASHGAMLTFWHSSQTHTLLNLTNLFTCPFAPVHPSCPPPVLQSGVSRELFETWCEDPRNCVVIADFAVQGTLARDILGNPAEVMTRSGIKVGA